MGILWARGAWLSKGRAVPRRSRPARAEERRRSGSAARSSWVTSVPAPRFHPPPDAHLPGLYAPTPQTSSATFSTKLIFASVLCETGLSHRVLDGVLALAGGGLQD